jgi:hypothetical protein
MIDNKLTEIPVKENKWRNIVQWFKSPQGAIHSDSHFLDGLRKNRADGSSNIRWRETTTMQLIQLR